MIVACILTSYICLIVNFGLEYYVCFSAGKFKCRVRFMPPPGSSESILPNLVTLAVAAASIPPIVLRSALDIFRPIRSSDGLVPRYLHWTRRYYCRHHRFPQLDNNNKNTPGWITNPGYRDSISVKIYLRPLNLIAPLPTAQPHHTVHIATVGPQPTQAYRTLSGTRGSTSHINRICGSHRIYSFSPPARHALAQHTPNRLTHSGRFTQ